MPMRQQAKTMAMPMRVPLIPELATRMVSTPLTKDARLINCYAEKVGQRDYDIYKRFGLANFGNIAAASVQGRGVYYSSPTATLLSVFGGNLYYNNVLIGAVDFNGVEPCQGYFFEEIVGAPRTIVLGDGAAAYIFNTSTHALTQITDINFPSQFVRGWAYLNGYLYIMDTQGSIWGSANTDNAAVWSGTNVIEASSAADMGVALVKQLSYIVAFKQWSTEVFYDAGNPAPGSSLGAVSEAEIAYGCLSDKTIQFLDGTILWVTANQKMGPQVARLDNLATVIISTPSIDRLLSNFFDNSIIGYIAVSSWCMKRGGHRLYGLNLLSLNLTLVYDLDQNLWYLWTDVNGNYWPIFEMSALGGAIGVNVNTVAQGYLDGNLYLVNPADEQPNDNGVIIPVNIYTQNFDAGTSRNKMVGGIYIEADRQTGSILYERHSDDDYTTWSNWRPIDLSLPRPFLRDMGTFRRRAHNFMHKSNTSLRIRAVDAQIDLGVT